MAQTPFGTMNEGAPKPKAPTAKEIAENPGAYAGSAFDPLTQNALRSPVVCSRLVVHGVDVYPRTEDGEVLAWAPGEDTSWAALFRWNREVARRQFCYEYGQYMDESKLSPEQRAKMGLI